MNIDIKEFDIKAEKEGANVDAVDDPDDKTLYNLIPVLKEIVVKKIKDVRKALRKIRDTMIRLYVRGDSTPYSTVLQYITGEKKLKE